MNHLFVNSQHIKSNNNLIVTCLCIYFLSLPLGAMELGILGSVLKFVAVLPVVVFCIKDPKLRITKISLLQLMYTLLLLISSTYSIEISSTLERVGTNATLCILLICMGSVVFKSVEIEKLRRSLIWSSRITCALVLVFGVSSADRLSLSGIITEDPNYLNGYFLFGVVNAVQVMINKSNFKQKSMVVVELLFYTYVSLSTGSRGGLICLLGAAFTVFLLEGTTEKRLHGIVKKISVLMLIAIISSVTVQFIPSNILERFTIDVILESKGTHRFEYWGWAINIFKDASLENQIFGFGAGTIRDIFGINGYDTVVAHNIFVEQLMEGGVITLIVYCYLIISCVLKSKERRDVFTLAALIGFIILSMEASLYSFKPYWNAIIFTCLLL